MPSPAAGLDPAAIIALSSTIRIGNNTGIAALTFLIFDYLLTFAQEVDFFWRPKLTGAAVIFFLNRYIVLATLLFNVSGVLIALPPQVHAHLHIQSCSPMVITTNVIAMVQYIPWAVFSTMRAFALSSKNLAFTVLIALLSLAPVGADIPHFVFGLNGEYDPVFGCVDVDPIDPALSQKSVSMTIISRACLIFADLLLIIATWAAVSRTVNMRTLAMEGIPSFGAVLLRDGAVYFIILLLLNSLHLTLTLLSILEDAFQNASVVLQFVHPITGILVARFLLDLQSTNRQVMHVDLVSTTQPQTGTIVFDRAVFTLERGGTIRSFKCAGSDSVHEFKGPADRSSKYSAFSEYSIIEVEPRGEREDLESGPKETYFAL